MYLKHPADRLKTPAPDRLPPASASVQSRLKTVLDWKRLVSGQSFRNGGTPMILGQARHLADVLRVGKSQINYRD